MFVARLPRPAAPGSQQHAPGWSASMDGLTDQHLVYDAEIVDGLVHAWKARKALDLPDETARKIADRIHRVAHSRFWRWPAMRLNQVNWYALVYAADATVTGRPALLRRDLRAQLARFAAGPRNFMAGLRFQYLPHFGPHAKGNVDSAEYANIVLSFLRFYNQGRHAGMAPLPRAGRGLVRRWIRRAVAGYWTHAGYLNWDSGLGFERWHQAKKLGLAQQALIGIAQTPRLQPGREWGRWAKWMLDRGLRFYERLPVREGGLPDPVLFQLFTVPQTVGSARLAAVRLEANAMRAVEAGLGRMAGEAPPPLYAFDPDIGRLAISTPRYNTAVIATNQRAFPYGGIELARLFDGEQDVAAGIGGRAPAAFGLLVREPSGRRVFSSQTGRAGIDPRVTPLRLTRAPAGTGASVRTRPGKVFAGPFRDLRARGTLTAGRFRAVTSHRFTRDFIETRWQLQRLRGRARLHARRAAAELGRRERARRRRAARRVTREPALAHRGARAGGALRGDQPEQRLRRRAAAPAARCDRPGGGSVPTILSARSGSDARRRARARCELAAGLLRRPDRGRPPLAPRSLGQDQLAAAQGGSDLAGLLDLRVRVADRVVDGLDVYPWDAHGALCSP